MASQGIIATSVKAAVGSVESVGRSGSDLKKFFDAPQKSEDFSLPPKISSLVEKNLFSGVW